MSAEVDWTLDAIEANWSAGSYSDIPIERVDRDESEQLDGNVRDHQGELREANFVGATLAEQSLSPIGTEYDHQISTTVSVRIEGLHKSQFGYIDPDATLPPGTRGDPVPWDALVNEIRRAILTDRSFPSVNAPDTGYHSAVIVSESPQSAEWADYYRHDIDLELRGFESLP